MRSGKLWFLALAMCVMAKAYPQLSSPYTSNGIGELAFQGMPQNYAMGEVGIGSPSPWHINSQNPSLLTYNSFSSFEVGVEGDFRKLKTTNESLREGGLSLRYLAMSFPILKKGRWVTSFALLPLSTVNYHTIAYHEIDDIYAAKSDYYGEGGISQLTWGNGFRLFKQLSIGFQASYVFGSINEEAVTRLGIDSLIRDNGILSGQVISYQEETSYSDFKLSFGASYRFFLGDSKYLNIGAVYQQSKDLSGKRDVFYERQNSTGSTFFGSELIIEEGVEVQTELPVSYGFGLSYEQAGSFKIAMDIRRKQWGDVSALEAGESYRNATDFGLGGEFIPNYRSITSYFSRVAYRLGISYKQSPYIINGTKINDFGINFGASFPVRGVSSLETAFKLGTRGTTQNDLIKENYFQFVIGATINDKWFERRLYD